MLKVKDHCYYTDKCRDAAYVIYNIVYLKEIYMAFHNGSIYDCHFIIKELAKEFEREYNSLEENSEKCKPSQVQ